MCENEVCSAHERVDSATLSEGADNLITYVGEYVVQTGMSPELLNENAFVAWNLGLCHTDDYITQVLYVGHERATLSEGLRAMEPDDIFRYWVRHADWDNLQAVHDAIVEGVKDGSVDVSEPRGSLYTFELDNILARMRVETAMSLGRTDEL